MSADVPRLHDLVDRAAALAELEAMCEPMLATFDNWGVAPSEAQIQQMAEPFIAEILRQRSRVDAERAERQVTAIQAAYWCGRLREVALVAWSQIDASVDEKSLTILNGAAQFAALCERAARS